jgi:hypothetical protein
MPVTGEQIREHLRVMPFRPFRLSLADQRTFEVRHPDFAMVVPSRRHLIVFSMENLESWCMIDVALIVSLEPIDERPSASQAA